MLLHALASCVTMITASDQPSILNPTNEQLHVGPRPKAGAARPTIVAEDNPLAPHHELLFE